MYKEPKTSLDPKWGHSLTGDVHCRRIKDQVEYVYTYPMEDYILVYNGRLPCEDFNEADDETDIAETLSRLLKDCTILAIAEKAKNIYGLELSTSEIFGFGVTEQELVKFLKIKGITK